MYPSRWVGGGLRVILDEMGDKNMDTIDLQTSTVRCIVLTWNMLLRLLVEIHLTGAAHPAINEYTTVKMTPRDTKL